MNILFFYYNEGFVLKTYKLETLYFIEISFLDFRKTFPCPNEFVAIELSKEVSNFYTEDLQKFNKKFKFDEDLNPPFF